MPINREIAHARTIATGIHQGQLDGDGTPVLDRLAITAGLLDDFDDPVLSCAVWLHLAPRTVGLTARDLLRLGVSDDVTELVMALQPVGDETNSARVSRICAVPDAALVELAIRLVLFGGRSSPNSYETALARAAGGWGALVMSRAAEHFAASRGD